MAALGQSQVCPIPTPSLLLLAWQLEGELTGKLVFCDEPQFLPEHMKESSQYAFLLHFNQTQETLVLLIVIHCPILLAGWDHSSLFYPCHSIVGWSHC